MYMTVKEAADFWKISERRVRSLCENGRIPGATRDGRRWQIPSYAQKPVLTDSGQRGTVALHRGNPAAPICPEGHMDIF